MQHKSFDILETKADAEAGTFEATVAVFNNVDKGGDRILPGAFTKTLAEWERSGDPIPVILSHSWDNPFHHIGVAYPGDIKQTDKGLLVRGTLDIADNEVARQVHRLMARRSLKEFSFGYSVPAGGEKRTQDGANDLSEISLVEVGPTLKGMNPATELHSVKKAIEAEAPPDPPSETELRQEFDRHRAEEATKDAPEVEPGPSPIEVLSEQVGSLKEELEAIRSTLDEKLKALEKAADPDRADEERFRREARKAVVDLDLDGIGSRIKPPEPQPEPEREPEWALKARVDREMFDLMMES